MAATSDKIPPHGLPSKPVAVSSSQIKREDSVDTIDGFHGNNDPGLAASPPKNVNSGWTAGDIVRCRHGASTSIAVLSSRMKREDSVDTIDALQQHNDPELSDSPPSSENALSLIDLPPPPIPEDLTDKAGSSSAFPNAINGAIVSSVEASDEIAVASTSARVDPDIITSSEIPMDARGDNKVSNAAGVKCKVTTACLSGLSLEKKVNNEGSDDLSADANAANDEPDIASSSPGRMEGNEPTGSEATERKIQPTTRGTFAAFLPGENTRLPAKSSQFNVAATSHCGETATALLMQSNFDKRSDMTGAMKTVDERGTDFDVSSETMNEAVCNMADATKATDHPIGDAPEVKVESKGDQEIADGHSAQPRGKKLRRVQRCTPFDTKEDAPTAPTKPILDSLGNPVKFNQNDVILSMGNSSYKNVMYVQFKKLGKRSKPDYSARPQGPAGGFTRLGGLSRRGRGGGLAEKEEKAANEIFQMFKKGGGRFFRLDASSRYVMLNDQEALQRIRGEIRNRNPSHGKWRHIGAHPRHTRGRRRPTTTGDLVQLQKDVNALATTTCEHKSSNAATTPSMRRSSGRKRNRPRKFMDAQGQDLFVGEVLRGQGAQAKRKKTILGVQSAPINRPFTPNENRHFEQGCVLWGWGNWEQIQKDSLPERANYAAMIAEDFPEIKNRFMKEHQEISMNAQDGEQAVSAMTSTELPEPAEVTLSPSSIPGTEEDMRTKNVHKSSRAKEGVQKVKRGRSLPTARKPASNDKEANSETTMQVFLDHSGNPTKFNQNDVIISMIDSTYMNDMYAHFDMHAPFKKLGRPPAESRMAANEVFGMFKKKGGRFFKLVQHTRSTFEQVNEKKAFEKIFHDFKIRMTLCSKWLNEAKVPSTRAQDHIISNRKRKGEQLSVEKGVLKSPMLVPSQTFLDLSGNPTMLNQNDNIISTKNSAYKSIMYSCYKKLGPRRKNTGEDRKAENEIFHMFKKWGGRFFKAQGINSSTFKEVNDQEALGHMKRVIFRRTDSSRKWLDQEPNTLVTKLGEDALRAAASALTANLTSDLSTLSDDGSSTPASKVGGGTPAAAAGAPFRPPKATRWISGPEPDHTSRGIN